MKDTPGAHDHNLIFVDSMYLQHKQAAEIHETQMQYVSQENSLKFSHRDAGHHAKIISFSSLPPD